MEYQVPRRRAAGRRRGDDTWAGAGLRCIPAPAGEGAEEPEAGELGGGGLLESGSGSGTRELAWTAPSGNSEAEVPHDGVGRGAR